MPKSCTLDTGSLEVCGRGAGSRDPVRRRRHAVVREVRDLEGFVADDGHQARRLCPRPNHEFKQSRRINRPNNTTVLPQGRRGTSDIAVPVDQSAHRVLLHHRHVDERRADAEVGRRGEGRPEDHCALAHRRHGRGDKQGQARARREVRHLASRLSLGPHPLGARSGGGGCGGRGRRAASGVREGGARRRCGGGGFRGVLAVGGGARPARGPRPAPASRLERRPPRPGGRHRFPTTAVSRGAAAAAALGA